VCGICGVLGFKDEPSGLAPLVSEMVAELNHRGPDARGVWVHDGHVGFGHARLAVIDLSESGQQPMHSRDGRYTICYNGEIYNYQTLRRHLEKEGLTLRGHSDTEVLLECAALWGVDWVIERAHGMFSIALWDNQNKQLTLVRDRFGEKPLYYGLLKGQLVFSSELKPFRKHPDFVFNVNREALSAYVKYNYVPSPLCMLEGFRKLPAGSKIVGSSPAELYAQTPQVYWHPTRVDRSAVATIDEFEEELNQVVARQMVSDVPLGCFLSGGVDSSLITAIAQSQSSQSVDTFTIGFTEKAFDESEYALSVARHLGTKHTEWIIDQGDILNLVPSVAQTYDEPFADSSQLPTMLLSKMTRQNVTVCLSGDGGDELFGGYARYDRGQRMDSAFSRIPNPVRKSLDWVYRRRQVTDWVSTYKRAGKILPLSVSNIDDKLGKFGSVLGAGHRQEQLYDGLLSHWSDPAAIVKQGVDFSLVEGKFRDDMTFMENMMMHDASHYLIDNIMVKVDRAAMGVSLESRAPFLDHKLFELAWRMPIETRRHGGVGKYPLRSILYKHVPKELIERPKKGFSVPLAPWFRGELSEWVRDTLDYATMAKQGYFNPDPVQSYLGEHMDGLNDRHYHLWDILVFQEWLANWSD